MEPCCEIPAEELSVYYQDNGEISEDSSEVEYIEDDDNYCEEAAMVKPIVSEEKIAATRKVITTPKAKLVEDALLSLSVVIPSRRVDLDDDSSYSQDGGVFAKLPPYLVEKKGSRGSLKIESKPATASTTSEEHGTQVTSSMSEQTPSESGSMVGSSAHHELMNNKGRKILATWKAKMENTTAGLDMNDSRTANLLLELGSLHVHCEQYEEAQAYFSRALAISEAIYGSADVKVARVLEMYGMAESATRQDPDGLVLALSYMDRAFCIRYKALGPTHIDTVECLNKIARIQMKQNDHTGARDSYYQVLKLREAIFGNRHPCVAVTAQTLAAIHAKLSQVKEAKFYFRLALGVYEHNGLQRHRLADVIRRDLNELKNINTKYEI